MRAIKKIVEANDPDLEQKVRAMGRIRVSIRKTFTPGRIVYGWINDSSSLLHSGKQL